MGSRDWDSERCPRFEAPSSILGGIFQIDFPPPRPPVSTVPMETACRVARSKACASSVDEEVSETAKPTSCLPAYRRSNTKMYVVHGRVARWQNARQRARFHNVRNVECVLEQEKKVCLISATLDIWMNDGSVLRTRLEYCRVTYFYIIIEGVP